MKTALIFGITGQDGSYLAEFLVERGYEVHGIIRRSSGFNTGRIDHIFDRLILHHGDVTDAGVVFDIIQSVNPDEIYNLAAQSHVQVSFKVPHYTSNVTALGALNVLEAVRRSPRRDKIRIYQASSSEMFGGTKKQTPLNESSKLEPRSPYAAAKVFAHHLAANYRESYRMHVVSGILFNHTSERRGETFVCRKITRAVGRILAGLQTELVLGRLDPQRDWGYAPDYVQAMHLLLQNPTPEDLVIGTGEMHSVQEFAQIAFAHVGLDWMEYVVQSDRYHRPSEVIDLIADPAQAKAKLGWKPTVTFLQMVQKMVLHDVMLAEREKRVA